MTRKDNGARYCDDPIDEKRFDQIVDPKKLVGHGAGHS
jgi:hypothetical protein